jgi:hypothetical protein
MKRIQTFRLPVDALKTEPLLLRQFRPTANIGSEWNGEAKGLTALRACIFRHTLRFLCQRPMTASTRRDTHHCGCTHLLIQTQCREHIFHSPATFRAARLETYHSFRNDVIQLLHVIQFCIGCCWFAPRPIFQTHSRIPLTFTLCKDGDIARIRFTHSFRGSLMQRRRLQRAVRYIFTHGVGRMHGIVMVMVIVISITGVDISCVHPFQFHGMTGRICHCSCGEICDRGQVEPLASCPCSFVHLNAVLSIRCQG